MSDAVTCSSDVSVSYVYSTLITVKLELITKLHIYIVQLCVNVECNVIVSFEAHT